MEFHSKKYSAFTKRSIGFGMMLFLCLGFYAGFAQNQIRITTNVLPPYSPYIQDYPGTGNRVQVFISNLSGRALSVRLLGKLEGDNGVVIRTSQHYRPLRPLELRPTDVNRMITRAELEGLFDLNQIEVEGLNKDQLYRGLPLPEGNYQLCVQAFDNATTRPLSAEFPMGCSGLIPVRIIEPPILISPMADEEIALKIPQTQLFTWSAPVGILPNQVEYSIRIVELPETNVDPNVYIDAMVLPRSGVEVNNLRTTTFLYGPQQPRLQKGKRYAWRVQAKPIGQRLNFLNDGKSPVQSFIYGQQMPLGVDLEYITITSPAAKRNASIEVGSNNPFLVTWKLDEEFEKTLRKAFEAQPKKSIVEQFAELGRYLREPIKKYSNGMRARLAFAISMAVEFDCFLIDEVVSVGDQRFHEKCHHELFQKRADRAMILVSHDVQFIRQHCTRASVLHRGQLTNFDNLDSAFEFYDASIHQI